MRIFINVLLEIAQKVPRHYCSGGRLLLLHGVYPPRHAAGRGFFERSLLAAIVLCAAGAMAGAEITHGRVYTLEKSVEDSLKNNQSVLFAKEEIKFAEARVKEAKSLLYPLVELKSTASRFGIQELYPFSEELGTVLLRPGMDSSKTHYTARATMKQTIFGGGRILSTMRLSRTFLNKARSEYDEIRNDVIYNVKALFYTLLVFIEKEKVFQRGLDELELLKRRSGGKSGGFDSLELLMEIDSIYTRIEELVRERGNAHFNYIKFLNVEQDLLITIDGQLEFVRSDVDLNKSLAWADEFRPKLKQTMFQEQIDALVVSLSMSERQPLILFGTSYEFSGLDLPLETENWNATLSLKLPIFDGWAQWSRVRQKRAQARQGSLTRARIKDDVHIQVRKALKEHHVRSSELDRISEMRKEVLGAINAVGRTAATLEKKRKLIRYRYETEEKYLDALEGAINSKIYLEYTIGRSLDQ